MVLSILGRGLFQHANESSSAVLHHRGHDHPRPDLNISALLRPQSIVKEVEDYFGWTKDNVQYVISLY